MRAQEKQMRGRVYSRIHIQKSVFFHSRNYWSSLWDERTCDPTTYRLVGRLLGSAATSPNTPMPQEVSVSYQAVKSKVYRLVDALVAGEKTEAEVQESIRRWWELIHPADRPIAQKYLSTVLERSTMALIAVEEGLEEASRLEIQRSVDSGKALKMVARLAKHASLSNTI